MRRFASTAIAAALLLGACGGKGKPAPDPAATAPLMWVVSADAGPTYLFGTMHLGIDVRNDVNPIVFSAIETSKTFVMEVDAAAVAPAVMMEYAELPANTSLASQLSARDWSRLTDALPGFPEDTLARYRPWFVVVLVTQSLLPSTANMDDELHTHAKANGLGSVFLEDWKYQLELIDAVIGLADVVDMLENMDDTKQELRDLVRGYKAGDAAAIEALLYDAKKYEKNPKVVDVLLERRNREWMPKLVPVIDEGNAFVAVGVGHLVGDEGVVALLRRRGYTVERVTLPGPARERPAEPAAAGR